LGDIGHGCNEGLGVD